MGLMEEIETEIKRGGSPKWAILKEKAEKEILKMIEAGIPIEKQVELLLKYKIVEKLERKEYTGIIKKHFGYQGARRRKKEEGKPVKKAYKKTAAPTAKKIEEVQPVAKEKKSIEERLSEDIDLMDSFLKKKAAAKKV